MRASFSSREADNHTAFIRIKTNASDSTEFIILPVEVEVTTGLQKSGVFFLLGFKFVQLFCWVLGGFGFSYSAYLTFKLIEYIKYNKKIVTFFFFFFLKAPGIYSSTEMLDFGTLRTQGKLCFKSQSICEEQGGKEKAVLPLCSSGLPLAKSANF